MKLFLCVGCQTYHTFWIAAAPSAEVASLYHPRGLLKWNGSEWRYLPGKEPTYDARYHNLEKDGSFDCYKVGTLYYDQIAHFRNGPADISVLRCLGEAELDLAEGVVCNAGRGVESSYYFNTLGDKVRLS